MCLRVCACDCVHVWIALARICVDLFAYLHVFQCCLHHGVRVIDYVHVYPYALLCGEICVHFGYFVTYVQCICLIVCCVLPIASHG